MNGVSPGEIDPEVESLLAEMQERPALVCPIRSCWKGDQEQADQIGIFVRLYAQVQVRTHPWLKFDNLVEITFNDDYETAVRKAAGPERTVRPTKGSRKETVWRSLFN
jgi:hypothetical protein